MKRVYLVIDLKTFYASVECVERGLDPFKTDLIVADESRGRGSICLAVSPSLKNKGVKNRCRVFEIPRYIHPIIAKPRMRKYMEYSARIYGIYLKYLSKDDIHVYSIDEAFLDITNYRRLYKKNFIEIAKMIMKDIYDTTGITATCGIGTNMYLAKIALDIISKHVKSNIGILNEKMYREKLWHYTPLTDFWRIGKGIEARLHRLHIKDMYDVAHTDENVLYKEFGVDALLLIDHAWGRESCTISDIKKYRPISKSISNGQILFKDYSFDKARVVLSEMVDNLVLELVSKGLYTGSIGVYIGYSKNGIKPLKISRKIEYTNSYCKILNEILFCYDTFICDYPIRRINISFGSLTSKKIKQLNLFENDDEDNVESTLINIKNRYGKNSILRGISYLEYSTARDRNILIGGHNAE